MDPHVRHNHKFYGDRHWFRDDCPYPNRIPFIIPQKPWPKYCDIEFEARSLLRIVVNSRTTQSWLQSAKYQLEGISNDLRLSSPSYFELAGKVFETALFQIETGILTAKSTETEAHDHLRYKYGYDSEFWDYNTDIPSSTPESGILKAIWMESQSLFQQPRELKNKNSEKPPMEVGPRNS